LDELEASPFKGTTTSTQPPTNLPPLRISEGATRGHGHKDYTNHEADTLNTTSQPPLNSMLQKIASVPEIDDWDWDELEASPSKGTTTSIQSQKNLPH